MAKFYSKSLGGFPDPNLFGAAMPADAVEISDDQHMALMAAQAAGQLIQSDASGNPVAVDRPAETLDAMKARLSVAIDTLVDGVYETYNKRLPAYTEREAAARAFSAAGYVGDPGEWVTGFAVPARLTSQQATDRIIAQADAARTALPLIDSQRMRKYELTYADGAGNAQAIYDDIAAQVKALSAGLA